ncbi:MAG: IS110 family transposase [Acetobacteraceae bacterium]|nr:IS110 family transposase [Acetobacteraceae bacterium]
MDKREHGRRLRGSPRLTNDGETMFAGIYIASERHMVARLDDQGGPIGKPNPITEDRAGYDALLKALGELPALVAMEATGHYWRNLFVVLVAAGHEVALLNPFVARRFQDSSLERTKTDPIDAQGLARLAFEKRPAPTHLHDEVAEELRGLVRHRDRLHQDVDDRVRQPRIVWPMISASLYSTASSYTRFGPDAGSLH